MPYASKAQEAWAHTKEGTKALGGPDKVKEWDESSKNRHMPERAGEGRRSKYREIYNSRKPKHGTE